MLIDNHYTYLKPVYTVQAYRVEELPAAFEQMEKLRHSGYLAGYFRRAAIFPEEHVMPELPDRPLLKFFLFRGREDMPATPEAHVFCPSVQAPRDTRGHTYAVTPPSREVYARDLTTACGGRELFNMLRASFQYSGYYRDAFEEVLCLSNHSLVDIDRTTLSDEERAHELPVRDLLTSACGGNETLAMGAFAKDRVLIYAADALFVRHGQDRDYCALVTPSDREQDPGQLLRSLCFPPDMTLAGVTRLQDGNVFLLPEHMERLKRLARSHEVPSAEIDSAGGLIRPGAPLPLPGDLAALGLGQEGCWSQLPDAWRASLTAQGVDLEAGPLALTLALSRDGAFSVSAKPVRESAPVLGYVRAALDDRSDLLQLDLAQPLPADSAAEERIADGRWHDALVVNRFAVVAGCTRSDLAFVQGTKQMTPPSDSGLKDDVVRALLLNRKLLQERTASLAQVMSSQALYCLDSVFGARLVEKADPEQLARETTPEAAPVESRQTPGCC